MQFKNFILDPFQEDAVTSIDKNHSVVVSAATGTGKTLIADYIIDKYIKRNRRIIYTAPIKALSNQKYRDFRADYGEDRVGLLTGDVSINPEGNVLIMTTEIYRNMLLSNDPMIDFVDYVIFDEIHFINDIERGTIWEESIIFSPNRIRFLCLSATIPNAEEFAGWMNSIKEHQVDVVTYDKRAVPLKHHVYDAIMGVTTVEKVMDTQDIPDYYQVVRKKKKKKVEYSVPFHFNLIRDIRDRLPAIFFVFSRKECQVKALELTKKFNFLTDQDRRMITQMAGELISPEYRSLQSIIDLKRCLNNGIAFHHAGLLPRAKELVEVLFAKGIIKVLYATETFAVGINMPAKSVAFSSVYKYDGINFRYLFTKEYFQMAGRAGRRGIDKQGDVFVLVDRNKDDFKKIKRMQSKDIEPIWSQFQISFNTVLNMMGNYDEPTRQRILESSFYTYQRKKEKATANIKNSFNNKLRTLQKVGFVSGQQLTDQGVFASKIYDKEILVTQLFAGDFYRSLSVEEMVALSCAIIYEFDRRDKFENMSRDGANALVRKIEAYDANIFNHLSRMDVKKLYHASASVCRDVEFSKILETTNLQEGDLIRLFRRTIDLLRQIRNATSDPDLADMCNTCINAVQKPPIKVEF